MVCLQLYPPAPLGTCGADEAVEDGGEAPEDPEQEEEHDVPGAGVAKLEHEVDIST